METINKEIEKPIAVLKTDEINTNLLFLLESRYIVITSQKDNEIILELFKK